MGKRLTKIYTRTGDAGDTGLGNGTRIEKDSPRIEAIGAIDELNSSIGVVLSYEIPDAVRECLTDIQHDLFALGGELSIPGQKTFHSTDIVRLESVLDEFNDELPYLEEFILPAGGPAASTCHLSRSICRRAERRLLALSRNETVNSDSLGYINRLSDLLFVISRILCRYEYGEEVYWDPSRNR
jgi:cob(I)alamin adenosyltransferase